LESIFSIVAVVENSTTDAQNHRPMTPDQRFKSSIFLANQKGFEQLWVRQPISFLQKGYTAKIADDPAHWRSCHTEYPGAWVSLAPLIYWPQGVLFPHLFSGILFKRVDRQIL
jgi:hypothetical protein